MNLRELIAKEIHSKNDKCNGGEECECFQMADLYIEHFVRKLLEEHYPDAH